MPKILKIDQFIDAISKYIKVRLDIVKNEMADQLSAVIAGVFALILVLFFLGIFCFFLSFGFAIYLNEVINSNFLGYIVVSFVYFILFIIVIRLAKSGKLKEVIKESFLEDE